MIAFTAKRSASNVGWAGTLANAFSCATCGHVVEFDASACDADALGKPGSAFAAIPDASGIVLTALVSMHDAFTVASRTIPFEGRRQRPNASRLGALPKPLGSLPEPLSALLSALHSLL
jgi:hypothetical protein